MTLCALPIFLLTPKDGLQSSQGERNYVKDNVTYERGSYVYSSRDCGMLLEVRSKSGLNGHNKAR